MPTRLLSDEEVEETWKRVTGDPQEEDGVKMNRRCIIGPDGPDKR